MFTVKECTAKEIACDECTDGCALCAGFGYEAREGDRIFVLSEGKPLAAGVLSLVRGKVVVRGVFGDIDASYRDLLCRSLLHVCRCMNPITVRVENTDSYWKRFGFAEKDGGLEIRSDEIKFEN